MDRSASAATGDTAATATGDRYRPPARDASRLSLRRVSSAAPATRRERLILYQLSAIALSRLRGAACRSRSCVRPTTRAPRPLALYGVTPWLYLPVYVACRLRVRRPQVGVAGAERCRGDGPSRDDLARHQATRSRQRRDEETRHDSGCSRRTSTSATDDLSGIMEEVRANDPDIAVFQEVTRPHRARAGAAIPSLPATRNRCQSPTTATLWCSHDCRSSRARSGTSRHGPWPAPACRRRSASVEIVAVHTVAPINDPAIQRWRQMLDVLHDLAEQRTTPLLLVGDFNATVYHPRFDDLLDTGLTDAHRLRGKGLTGTWPRDRPFPPLPAHRPRAELEGTRPDQGLVREGQGQRPPPDHRRVRVGRRRVA